MPERVSDERLAEMIREHDAALAEGLVPGWMNECACDLRDARQERDALRAAVREALIRIDNQARLSSGPFAAGHQRSSAILRDAVEGVMGE